MWIFLVVLWLVDIALRQFDQFFEHSWLDHATFVQAASHFFEINNSSYILSQFLYQTFTSCAAQISFNMEFNTSSLITAAKRP